MAELGIGQKPIVMPSYPHMMAEDCEVWTAFLKDPIGDIRKVWYDVHVGAPMSLLPGAGEMERKVAEGVSKKRIDVVCMVKTGYWVVEVKPIAGMSALGQVITYRRLFVQEYSAFTGVMGVVVCYDIDRDCIDDYSLNKIAVIRVDRS